MSNIKINLDSLNPTSFKKTLRHKIQDGANIYRFLPPFGEESNGAPYKKWNVIWGLIDPSSGRQRPFASSSTYEGECPVYDYLKILKEKVEKLAPTLDEKRLEELNNYISNMRPKTVYAYNAANKQGQVGVLELKSTAHKKVIAVMSQYITDYDQDPTSLKSEDTDSGLWFKITKTGQGFNTVYDAVKNQTMVRNTKGVPSYEDDRSPLAEAVVNNYNSLAYDLNNIYQKLTYDELKEILIANIINASTTLPEVIVPGFGADEVATSSAISAASANKTQLNLQADASSKFDSDDEDVIALADSILNS